MAGRLSLGVARRIVDTSFIIMLFGEHRARWVDTPRIPSIARGLGQAKSVACRKIRPLVETLKPRQRRCRERKEATETAPCSCIGRTSSYFGLASCALAFPWFSELKLPEVKRAILRFATLKPDSCACAASLPSRSNRWNTLCEQAA